MVDFRLPVSRRLAVLAAVALVSAQALSTAAPARAGGGTQVYLVPHQGHNDLRIKDSAGVVNDLTVFEGRVVDNAARLVAGNGCVNEDRHTVNCPEFSAANAEINLGGKSDRIVLSGRTAPYHVYGEQGNDFIRLRSAHGFAHGGPGEDVLELSGGESNAFGGPGNDWLDGRKGYNGFLFGEEGHDVLYGGEFSKLVGGDGNDWFDGGGPRGAYVCDGGPGVNVKENCVN
ncbi:hypothetical protein [Actinomadura macra]|uniref:hypothetical protein n=1 Tax=Actinomadura macra TaxID=46164 RepID=UPI000A981EF6|nr:hypothetical protein [Actinomadura macra]